MSALIKAEQMSIAYGDKHAVRNVSFSID